MAPETQADIAIRLYSSRSSSYDDSWHASFTKRFVSYLNLSPGQQVLDLACGSGLLSFLEADAVGSSGRVIGVDVTKGMLSEAIAKRDRETEKFSNLKFYEGDILKLEQVEAVKDQTFDLVTLASALVLFPDPGAAVRYWSDYLKPGGCIALDATHPNNIIFGMVLERTGRRLGLSIPYHREWSKSKDTLRDVLETAGLEVEQVVTIDNQAGYGRRYYEISDADDQFERNIILGDAATTFADPEIRKRAKAVFKEEWEKLAVNGKVEEVDAVFLGIARKRTTPGTILVSGKSHTDVLLSGGCRCQGVRYQSTAPPSSITFCHCRACQQVSGAPFLPFIQVPTSSFKFTSSSTLRTLKLSDAAERTFCSTCGSPITMVYLFEGRKEGTSLTMGSVDTESLKCEMPKVRKHIFLGEKAPWFELSDDGVERMETSLEAHLIKPYLVPRSSA
ncbi:S-adenosyl-L-methionine-dependent methyltransferase [Lindgomyces ingoldianus]|uniref:S-adenosyl-L-methionine-dependent methyltransferase n=1 Tax=Lindgomyces ingoldianus TaxID=673940 RepID=A0ACB6QAH7_9PLEO|nr:S-adenosyl-L-methionine-dependent methyltransferase [Lindgomyces ingoldianus]KAF2463921.1 S-adenosyl-L-methionine-dependent methyltransferase [Lindgomyces ingoldianus]